MPMNRQVKIYFFIELIIVFIVLVFVPIFPVSVQGVVFAAGDTMLARWMHDQAFEGKVEDVYRRVLPAIQKADLAFLNLECVLSDKGFVVEKGERRPFPYRARPEMVRFLSEAGVDIVSQANNHSGDYGPLALLDSIQILNQAGILSVGSGDSAKAARKIIYQEVGALKTAWIAFSTQEDMFAARTAYPGTFFVHEKEIVTELTPLIKEAKRHADVLFVSPHWGPNRKTKPTNARRVIAKQLIDAGADIILGHSAHVLQGMEIYKGKAILYDMGNLVFDTVSNKEGRSAMYFELILSEGGITKLIGTPIYRKRRAVDIARGKNAAWIKKTFINRSQALSKDFSYTSDDQGKISIPLANTKVTLLKKLKRRKPVKNSPLNSGVKLGSKQPESTKVKPDEIANFLHSIDFENGIRFLGYQGVEAVPQGYSFLTKIFFEATDSVPGPPASVYISLFSQTPKSGDIPSNQAAAIYYHETGDWTYPTTAWSKGDIVKDVSLFRPPADLAVGAYDVHLKIFQRDLQLNPIESRPDYDESKGLKIGEITIQPHNSNYKIEGLAAYFKPQGAQGDMMS